MAFIRINNRKNFLLPEVPKLHPESAAYSKFWRTQKKRCIEGYWSVDDAKINANLDGDIKILMGRSLHLRKLLDLI